MDNTALLIASVSVLWSITTALFVYIIKFKDNKSDKLENSISDLKNIVQEVKIDIATIKKDIENSSTIMLQLNDTIQKQGDFISILKINETKLSNRIHNIENDIKLIKKKLNL